MSGILLYDRSTTFYFGRKTESIIFRCQVEHRRPSYEVFLSDVLLIGLLEGDLGNTLLSFNEDLPVSDFVELENQTPS